MTTSGLMTADDLMRMEPEPGNRYELIRGELRRMAAAGGRHGEIGFEAGLRLGMYVREHELGRCYTSDTGFFLMRDPEVIVMPDVAFVRTARLPPEEERDGYMMVVPDLVIEVVSPTDRPDAVQEKVGLYMEAGVPLVWQIRPRERGAGVYRPGRPELVLGEDDTLDGEDVVPGFRLRIADVLR